MAEILWQRVRRESGFVLELSRLCSCVSSRQIVINLILLGRGLVHVARTQNLGNQLVV